MSTTGRRDARWGAALLAAVMLHAGVLAGLLISRTGLRLPTARLAPDVQLELDRLPAASPARADRPARRSIETSSVTPPEGLAQAPPTAEAIAASSAPVAAEPAPVAAAAKPQGRAAISDAWRVGSAAGPLHTLGADCSRGAATRTSAEQAACDTATSQARATELPAIDTLPAIKRGYYDAVVAKKEYDRSGAFKDMAKMQQARGMAGRRTHFDMTVGYHCTFKFGPGAAEVNAAAGRKIGFPPCPIHAPGAEPAPP